MTTKCDNCAGDGWYEDHADSHYGNDQDGCEKHGCPVQRQCEKCKGEGVSGMTTKAIIPTEPDCPTCDELVEALVNDHGARVVTLTRRWVHAGPWCDERRGGTEQCADCAPDGHWMWEGVQE